jgi:adenine specific DNA methylase Mod
LIAHPLFNEVLAKDEINRLLNKKVITSAKKYTQNGVSDEVNFVNLIFISIILHTCITLYVLYPTIQFRERITFCLTKQKLEYVYQILPIFLFENCRV